MSAEDTLATQETDRPAGRVRRLFAPHPGKDRDRPLRLRLRGAGVLAGLAAVVLARVAALAPGLVERVYTEGIGQAFGRAFAAVSGLAPFGLAGPVTGLFLLWMVWRAPVAVYHVIRSWRRVLNAIACGVLRCASATGVVTAAFYILWGLNYSQASLPVRLGWQAKAPSGDTPSEVNDELARYCRELVAATNKAYREATGTDDLGHASRYGSTRELDLALDRAYERVGSALALDPSFGRSRGPAKAFFPGILMSEIGLAGFYSPWTGEANYNPDMPGCQLPHVMAHEKAHQRGTANEAEANFFGYLTCVYSDDPYVRYAGLLFAQRQLVIELLLRDMPRGEALVKKRLPGVQRDVNEMKAFWKRFEGRARTVTLAVNDAYLRANRVEGGLRSYSLSARLVVLYARHNAGSCLPAAASNKNEDGRARSGSGAAAGS